MIFPELNYVFKKNLFTPVISIVLISLSLTNVIINLEYIMFQIEHWLTNVMINVKYIMFQISWWITNVIINVNYIIFQISHWLTYEIINANYIMFKISHRLTYVITYLNFIVWNLTLTHKCYACNWYELITLLHYASNVSRTHRCNN